MSTEPEAVLLSFMEHTKDERAKEGQSIDSVAAASFIGGVMSELSNLVQEIVAVKNSDGVVDLGALLSERADAWMALAHKLFSEDGETGEAEEPS